MKKYEAEQIRNIGIIGHGSVGKTSLTEAFLFNAKMVTRLGKVDDGTTTTDFDDDEKKRKITINTAVAYCEWDKHKINLIDTPGFGDFMTDTQICLSVADAAVVAVCGVAGVEVMTVKTWNFAKQYNIPRFVFLNKMERERASFDRALESLRKAFGDGIIPVQLPIGQEASFKGVIDLITQKASIYKDASGAPTVGDVPADLKEDADMYRTSLMEKAAEGRDDLLEKYLESGVLTDEELIAGLKAGIRAGTICPVFCGAALNNIGVKELMDALVAWAPSPLERPAPKGKIAGTDTEAECALDPNAHVVAQVFKTFVDPFAGRVNLFRVYTGSMVSGSELHNLNKEKKERIAHVSYPFGKKQNQVDAVGLGDIGSVIKLTDTGTGDTLAHDLKAVVLPKFNVPRPIISFAVHPKTRGDEDKIGVGLHRLMEEDVTLQFKRDERTKEFLVSGMGQLHVEVIVEKLKHQFGVDVTLTPPKVPYLETIKGKIEVRGRYKKQSGGRGQYGDTMLRIEPLPRGGGFEFVDEVVGGVVPRQYIPAVEKGVFEAMHGGILAGYPAVDIRITLFDGSYHDVDSSEMAFKIAGSMGFKEGAPKCRPTLLEPIMKMEVIVPEECMGDIMGDINGRRGRVLGMENQAGMQVIRALVPMAEILQYAPTLKSITAGRGTYMMDFDHYDEVPAHLQEKIIAESKKAHETEE